MEQVINSLSTGSMICNYMESKLVHGSKELDLNDIKRISLEGLVTFRDLCKKHNLRYYLAYGTLLGAIRHHGFIPWDDDIDLWMPREDYNKLICISSEFETEEWTLLSPETSNGYYNCWAKYCHKKTTFEPVRFTSGLTYGVPIDIFPLDKIPSFTNGIAPNVLRKIFGIFYMVTLKPAFAQKTDGELFPLSASNKINRKIFRTPSTYFRRINKLLSKLSRISKGRPACIASPVRRVFNIEWFSESICISFENQEFTVPQGYHEILTSCYGDYMVPPPENMQVTHHNFKAYYLEDIVE